MLRPLRSIAMFLACHEIWPVALLVAASIVSSRALPLALVIAGVFWLIRWLAYGHLTVRTPADWAVALLILMLPVTLWATAWPDTTRTPVYRLLTGIALYYAIVNWATTYARLRWLISGTLISGTSLALIAPLSVEWIVDKLVFIPPSLYDRFPLLLSDTIHPNIIAGQLVILLPPALALILFSWQQLDQRERMLAGIGALVISSILLLSQSRGALIGLAGTVLGLTLLRLWRSWLLLPILGAAVLIAARLLGSARVLEIVMSNSILTRGVDGRLDLWLHALYIIQDFPLTGIGMGLFGPIVDTLYPLSQTSAGYIFHSHNLFLQIAIDLGLPGLIGWLAILILVVMSAWQVYRYGRVTGDNWVAAIGAGLLCSQVALLGHGLTDAVTWGSSRPAPIVWGMWGLTIAAWRVLVVKSGE